MTYIPAELRRFVEQRARGYCEYCGVPDNFGYLPHEVDHIYAEKHGGQTIESNLGLSCFFCNRYKGSDLASLDPIDGATVVRLFHPRRDTWSDHFQLVDARIEPRTDVGRVTVRLYHFNDTERITERVMLLIIGHYPFM